MKTIMILAGLIAANSYATLIPISPEQFFEEQAHFVFFDEARVVPYQDEFGNVIQIHGFVSRYGYLNGGVYFNTDLFANAPTTTAMIQWDFSTLPGIRLTHIAVFDANNDTFYYQIPLGKQAVGSEIITDAANINGIDFFGPIRNVPDAGSTISLLALGLLGIAGFRRA